MENKLIFALVGRNSGEDLVNAAKSAGAWGGTIIPCRSISDNALLQFFGIGESDQDVVLIVTGDKFLEPILEAMKKAALEDKRLSGFAAVAGVGTIMRFLAENNRMETFNTGEKTMDRHTHEMIYVIVNSGFADDVMAAARKAGAHGGTVLNARGTGKQEDVKFFGITIVPEKEILLIVAEKDKSSDIMDAIKAMDCFATPGSGIVFTSDVDNFTILGKK
ncbi:MAG: P-II family nitrogen regulator [Spirochaetia bacterium]|nr:P-II family nitrogen regulator [Spirochaetia bacterium]MBR0318132.1 P-II family nitrogen regulator [Spirochaetia bacterium]